MRKISKKSVLNETELKVNVISAIKEQLNILDENYGENRDIEKELGGYVLILETKEDIDEAKENILKEIIPEYVDNIECEGGELYCLALFLLSSDYAVVVVATKELMDILINE